MTDAPDRPVGTSPRADARRNRSRVLEAAQAVFAEDGLSVPLDEIARRAGVGAGTVYRHFPSKAALFAAVVQDRIEQLAADACALTGADDPGAAFFAFFTQAVEHASMNRALCEALAADAGLHVEVAPEARGRYLEALGVLLARAQRAGAVRADVDVSDVRDLMVGCVTALRSRDGSPGRMTAIVCDGLRADGPHERRASAARVVTKPVDAVSMRNETSGLEGDETLIEPVAARCEMCGTPIRAARTGRPPRFCGAACRQKAHRRRART